MKKQSYLILVFIAATILLLSVFAFKRYLPYTGTNLAPKDPPNVILSMENAYLVGVGDKGKIWSVRAKKVEIGRNRSYTTVKCISDGKIFDGGKTILRMKAGSAICDTFHKDLQLADGVLVEDMDGQSISGRGAVWKSRTSTLSSTGNVCFKSSLGRVNTDQLEVNVKNKEMNMKNVQMQINVKKIEDQAKLEAHKNAH